MISLIPLFASFGLLPFSPSAEAAGRMTLSPARDGSTEVLIEARAVFPDDLSNKQLKDVQSNLDFLINRKFVHVVDGKRYTLSLKTSAVRSSEVEDPNPLDNHFSINNAVRGHAFVDAVEVVLHHDTDQTDCVDVILDPANRSTVSTEDLELASDTVPHELLHLLGLWDRYHNSGFVQSASRGEYSITDPGFDYDVMGSRGPLRHPTHIRSFIEFARELEARGEKSAEISRIRNYNVCKASKKSGLRARVEQQLRERLQN